MAGQPEPSQADGTVTPTEARPGPDWSSASRESARGVIMITVTMIEEVRAGSGLGRWQPGPPRPGWPGPGVPGIEPRHSGRWPSGKPDPAAGPAPGANSMAD